MTTSPFYPATADHRRLRWLEGSWTGEETHHPFPGFPESRTAEVEIHSRMLFGGLYLERDYRTRRDGELLYHARGLYGWSEADQVYTLSWFDSSGSPPLLEATGSWHLPEGGSQAETDKEDAPLGTLLFEYPRLERIFRASYVFPHSREYHFLLESRPPAEDQDEAIGAEEEAPWTPILSGIYRQSSSEAPALGSGFEGFGEPLP
ncbi:MAG: DUF1579 family protein [Acidobacteriota bacterium]